MLTGLLCGLAPAFAAIHTSVNGTLKETGRIGTTGSGLARLRSVLVAAEIAIALVLLTASGLLLRSFEKMRAVDVGFRPDHTLTALYELPSYQYPTQASVDTFDEQALRNLRQLPGVEAVAGSRSLGTAGQAGCPNGSYAGAPWRVRAPDVLQMDGLACAPAEDISGFLANLDSSGAARALSTYFHESACHRASTS